MQFRFLIKKAEKGKVMKCDHCGVINVDDADYCRGCGQQLSIDQNSTKNVTTSNDRLKEKNKKSPLSDMKNKVDKLSYGIIALTVSLILVCFLPFVYRNAESDYSLTLVELLPETDSHPTTINKGLSGAEVGAILILACSILGIFFASKRKPALLNSVLLSILFWVWLICDTVSEWTQWHDYTFGVGGWYFCIMPVIICCMSIKQYSLQKNIKELTLYYKANGIMEYTADDFIICPFCKKTEFVKEAGYCRNCDFEGDYKSVKYIHYMILICALENLIAAILTTNSNWIEIFGIVRLGSGTVEEIHSLDEAMSLIYWIILVFWLMPGIAAQESNKNTFLFFSVLYGIMSIAVICHIFLLANLLPYGYSQGCTLSGWVIIIGCISEVIVIIKKWKNAKPFFCKKI